MRDGASDGGHLPQQITRSWSYHCDDGCGKSSVVERRVNGKAFNDFIISSESCRCFMTSNSG